EAVPIFSDAIVQRFLPGAVLGDPRMGVSVLLEALVVHAAEPPRPLGRVVASVNLASVVSHVHNYIIRGARAACRLEGVTMARSYTYITKYTSPNQNARNSKITGITCHWWARPTGQNPEGIVSWL